MEINEVNEKNKTKDISKETNREKTEIKTKTEINTMSEMNRVVEKPKNRPKKKPSAVACFFIALGMSGIAIGMNLIVSIIGIAIPLTKLALEEGVRVMIQSLADEMFLMEISLKYAYELTALYMILSFLAIFLILKLRKIRVSKEIKMEKVKISLLGWFVFFLPLGYGLSVITNNVLDLLDKFIHLPGLEQVEMLTNLNDSPFWIKFLAVAVCAPFFEEFLFRGVILNELKKGFPAWFAISFQGLLFGIFHLNLTQGMYAFGLGVIFGYFVYGYQSIWPGIIMHALINGMAVVFTELQGESEGLVATVQDNVTAISFGFLITIVAWAFLEFGRKKFSLNYSSDVSKST